MIFELHCLGGTEESYTLGFSRLGAQVIAQYYNLIHLGFDGFRAIMENCLSNARLLSKSLEATGWYTYFPRFDFASGRMLRLETCLESGCFSTMP